MISQFISIISWLINISIRLVIGFLLKQVHNLPLIPWGTWVAQSVQRLTLDFSSGHDLTVHEIEPHVGLQADSAESAWDSLSSLSASLLLSPE